MKKILMISFCFVLGLTGVLVFGSQSSSSDSIDDYLVSLTTKGMAVSFDDYEDVRMEVTVTKGARKGYKKDLLANDDSFYLIEFIDYALYNSLTSIMIDVYGENSELLVSFEINDILVINSDVGNGEIKAKYVFIDESIKIKDIIDQIDKKEAKFLMLKSSGIADVASILKFEDLEYISIDAGNYTIDFFEFAKYKNLKHFKTYRFTLKNTRFLSELTNLRSLNSSFQIMDFEDISSLKKLESLYASASTIKGELEFNNLKRVWLNASFSRFPIRNIMKNSSSKLMKLELFGALYGSFDDLAEFKNLKILEINCSEYNDGNADYREKYPNLEYASVNNEYR